MHTQDLSTLIAEFLNSYDTDEKDRVWKRQSEQFRNFWTNKIADNSGSGPTDSESDVIIRFLDRSAKGNTKTSEAVARAMIAQGAWRRMFREFHKDAQLRDAVGKVLEAGRADLRAASIDALYELNKERKNNLTGPSGNAISAFLALSDPMRNISVISLKDRKALLDFLGVSLPFNWDSATVGKRIASTNDLLVEELNNRGLAGSARALSVFCYSPAMRSQWKDVHTVKRVDQDVDVVVPTAVDLTVPGVADGGESYGDEIRESMQIQALLARIGAEMGYSIWLPRVDRGRVLKAWNPKDEELLDDLPLGYDSTTLKTIEQIDVLWLKRRTIVRAFEVEHTTSVYSGLLRMADLIALQPNLNIKLHIVAPANKHDKVLQEIRRPVFALLEGCPLAEICTFLSYKSIREIANLKVLQHLSDSVIDDYEEAAD